MPVALPTLWQLTMPTDIAMCPWRALSSWLRTLKWRNIIPLQLEVFRVLLGNTYFCLPFWHCPGNVSSAPNNLSLLFCWWMPTLHSLPYEVFSNHTHPSWELILSLLWTKQMLLFLLSWSLCDTSIYTGLTLNRLTVMLKTVGLDKRVSKEPRLFKGELEKVRELQKYTSRDESW